MRLHSICLSLSGISRRLITLTLQRHTPCLVVRGPRQNSATIVRDLCHRYTSHVERLRGLSTGGNQLYRPSLHRRRGNQDPAPSELRLPRTAVRTFPRELSVPTSLFRA
ncbi:hypothetical protein CABS01_12663 [Colletotrichum abscissum]|uniref:uncharacterized protein n=1 Tax=Colletotrichum abscissum TaxID=1671311 RepID=UPI0027D64034|nr:uncharacterized protein CABS01_12663 [Colletotrichum abscissum]KAK1489512.1 hypothetical protein CABS01_12663 [Colletotrichum abscissum]